MTDRKQNEKQKSGKLRNARAETTQSKTLYGSKRYNAWAMWTVHLPVFNVYVLILWLLVEVECLSDGEDEEGDQHPGSQHLVRAHDARLQHSDGYNDDNDVVF